MNVGEAGTDDRGSRQNASDFHRPDRHVAEPAVHEVIVRALEQNGIAGATVLSGIMGYGSHRRIHRKGLLGVSDDKPLTIAAIDNEKKLRDVLPAIRPIIRGSHRIVGFRGHRMKFRTSGTDNEAT